MKYIFSLMLCMTMLCISTVSYGSDGAKTTKTSDYTIDNVDHAFVAVSPVYMVDIDLSVPTFDNDTFVSNDVALVGSLETSVYKTCPITVKEDGFNYTDKDYINYLDAPEKPSAKAVLDSNHVGKLSGLNNLIVTIIASISETGYNKLE
jgi:hypothetical protein